MVCIMLLHYSDSNTFIAKLAAELWKKIFQRILQLLEMGCKYFPDNAMVLYRMLSPVEMGNEGFRLDSRLGRVSNQAKNYKHSMQAWIISKYGR